MSVWLISLFFAIGLTAFVYAKLTRAHGNADPRQGLAASAIAGVIGFIVIFTLFKFVFGFK